MNNDNQRKSFFKNISWIFIGNIVHAIFSFAINIVVARILTTNENGILNYAASWISFYNAISSLGINSVINKFTTDNVSDSNKYLMTAIAFRIISGLLGSLFLVLTMVLINPYEKTVLFVSSIQSLSILFSAGDTLVFWFRYKREANVVACLRLISFLLSAIIRIFSILVFKNIYLYTFGLVLETLFFSTLLYFQYRKKYTKEMCISITKFKIILKSSYPFIFSSILATIYAQTDKIMLKNMLGNNEVAYYSIAVTIAGMMSIVVSAIIEGFRPEIIAKKMEHNEVLYNRRLSQLYCLTFWICIVYGIFITLFSREVILIFYGEKYLSSQPALSLIVWYTSFSYFGTINCIYMVSEGLEKMVQLTTLIGAIANILLNLLLIPILGIRGAALASLITQIIANFISLIFIKKLNPIYKLILDGIRFKNFNIKLIFIQFFKNIRKLFLK